MKKINVLTKEKLEELRNVSLLTWAGMSDSEENLKAIERAARANGFNKKEIEFYIWTGNTMNTSYKLTGNNAYSDDLTFVGIGEFYNPMFKARTGARWLDDIIDGDLNREE